MIFYLGEAVELKPGDLECSQPPCPANRLVGVDGSDAIATILDGREVIGAALVIIENKWFQDSIGNDGDDARLRGCFFNMGKLATRGADLMTAPYKLRPAPVESCSG